MFKLPKNTTIIFLGIISLAFFGVAGVVSAAPAVLGVTGDLTQGASVMVAGGGFGTKVVVPPISWDNFEGGSDGANLSSPVIGPTWTFLVSNTSNPKPKYNVYNTHAGSKSALIQWTAAENVSFGWTNQGPYNELYISFWRYMDPQDPSEIPFNHKILYIYGNHNIYPVNNDGCSFEMPQFMVGAIMWNSDHWRYAVQNCPTSNWIFPSNTPDNWAETIQKWQRWEVYVKLDNPYTASNGEIKGWIDGQPTISQTGLNLTDVDGLFKDFRLGHMYQGYHPGGTDKSYFDDVYIDTTQARVEVCSGATFATRGKCEIQIPSTWSDTSATITLNQGSFTDLNNTYLYVIDANGNVNTNGYLLTTVDTTPPSIPTSLSATTISSSQINLSWTASTDNVGVAGYNIYRDGVQIATSTTTLYSNTGLTASTAYSYTVSAYDAAGNESIQSTPISITTLPLKGDFNSDSKVNNLDFTQFKNAFKSIFNSIFDLNSDSAIDVKDLGVLMSGWLE